MGYTNLIAFRSRLLVSLGDRDFAKSMLDGWINDGYFDMTGAFEFVRLRDLCCITLESEKQGVTLPSDVHWIRGVFNSTDRTALTKLASEHFHSIAGTAESNGGAFWTRDGQTLFVQSPFNSDREIVIYYQREPKRLVSDDDISELPATYDKAIHMFATYAALTDLGEENRAAEWRNNAIIYLRSRLSEDSYESMPGNHAGVRIVTNTRDLERLYRDGVR